MAQKVNQEVIGVVENMSWFTGEDGTRYQIFGEAEAPPWPLSWTRCSARSRCSPPWAGAPMRGPGRACGSRVRGGGPRPRRCGRRSQAAGANPTRTGHPLT